MEDKECQTPKRRNDSMPGIYKTIELIGTSPVSFAEAVKAAESSTTTPVIRRCALWLCCERHWRAAEPMWQTIKEGRRNHPKSGDGGATQPVECGSPRACAW